MQQNIHEEGLSFHLRFIFSRHATQDRLNALKGHFSKAIGSAALLTSAQDAHIDGKPVIDLSINQAKMRSFIKEQKSRQASDAFTRVNPDNLPAFLDTIIEQNLQRWHDHHKLDAVILNVGTDHPRLFEIPTSSPLESKIDELCSPRQNKGHSGQDLALV